MRYKVAAILFLLVCSFFNSKTGDCYSSDSLLLVTNEFPPYTIIKEDAFSGIAVEIVEKISNLAGCSCEIITLPWKRALKESQSRNLLLFPYTRRPYRENQFKWIGPIMTDTFVFAVNRKYNRHFSAIDDFRELEIGVVQGTPTVYRLKKMGFKKLQPVMQEKQNAFKMVFGDRIDAWYVPELILTRTLRSEGINLEKVRIAYRDIDVDMYIAASLSVPDEIVALWPLISG